MCFGTKIQRGLYLPVMLFFVSDIYILHNDIKNLHMLNKNGNKLNQLYASNCFLFHCTFLVEQSMLQLLGYFY